jgi:hypothetical protein
MSNANDTLRRKIPSKQKLKIAMKTTNLHVAVVPAITKLCAPLALHSIIF